MNTTTPEVVDLFCGVGALSHGLKLAGCNIVAGYDTDKRCKHAYETNNDAVFFDSDVGELTADENKNHYSGNAPTVLAGCAPCQPFSSYKHRYDEDPQWGLVEKFARLAAEVQPDFVTMENVPAAAAPPSPGKTCGPVGRKRKATAGNIAARRRPRSILATVRAEW